MATVIQTDPESRVWCPACKWAGQVKDCPKTEAGAAHCPRCALPVQHDTTVHGHKTALALQKALGITFPCSKIVVVADVKEATKVYVVGMVRPSQVDAIAAAVAGVEVVPVENVDVADDCTVTVRDKENSSVFQEGEFVAGRDSDEESLVNYEQVDAAWEKFKEMRDPQTGEPICTPVAGSVIACRQCGKGRTDRLLKDGELITRCRQCGEIIGRQLLDET